MKAILLAGLALVALSSGVNAAPRCQPGWYAVSCSLFQGTCCIKSGFVMCAGDHRKTNISQAACIDRASYDKRQQQAKRGGGGKDAARGQTIDRRMPGEGLGPRR